MINALDAGFGIVGNGSSDETSKIQNLLNFVSTYKDKVVFFPQASYLIEGKVVVPNGVQILGTYQGFTSHVLIHQELGCPQNYCPNLDNGTLFLVTSENVDCTFEMESCTTLSGVTFFQPLQNPNMSEPVGHPWLIKIGNGAWHAHGVTIENVEMVNPYLGILSLADKVLFRNITGQPLGIGIEVDINGDVCRIENCHFTHNWTYNTPLHNYQRSQGIAYLIRFCDGLSIRDSMCLEYSIGVLLDESVHPDWIKAGGNGVISNTAGDDCGIGLLVKHTSWDVNVNNCNFPTASNHTNVLVDTESPFTVNFNGCAFGAFGDNITQFKVQRGNVIVNGCSFSNGTGPHLEVVNADHLIVANNRFFGTNPLIIRNGVQKGIVQGNIIEGPVTNQAGNKVKVQNNV